MGDVRPARPVKLFVGMLARDPAVFEVSAEKCAEAFGEVERCGAVVPFEHTGYYAEEMGEKLLRQFAIFRPLVEPDCLPATKLKTNEIEVQIAESVESTVPRPVNLDPGYLSASGVFLATTKNYSHRMYLGQGIYGEVTLHFHKGSFEPWPWTYPDYGTAGYIKFFNEARARYLQQLKRESPSR